MWRGRTLHNNFHFLLPFNLSLLHTGQSRHGFSEDKCSLRANSLLGHQSLCQSNQTLDSLLSIFSACCKKSNKVVSRPAHSHNLGLTLYFFAVFVNLYLLLFLFLYFCILCVFLSLIFVVGASKKSKLGGQAGPLPQSRPHSKFVSIVFFVFCVYFYLCILLSEQVRRAR